MKRNIPLLIEIAKKTGLNSKAKVTTIAFAKELNISQQSTSRRLKEIEDSGLINRESSTEGIIVELTKKGRDKIKEIYEDLRTLIKAKEEISGELVTGLGEGKYYVSKSQYKNQFKKLLGIEPYPGTLNLQVKIKDIRTFLMNKECVNIKGFEGKERSYGNISAYPIGVFKEKSDFGKKAAIIIPERTNHPEDVVEIIADFYIRGDFKLSDNDKLVLK